MLNMNYLLEIYIIENFTEEKYDGTEKLAPTKRDPNKRFSVRMTFAGGDVRERYFESWESANEYQNRAVQANCGSNQSNWI